MYNLCTIISNMSCGEILQNLIKSACLIVIDQIDKIFYLLYIIVKCTIPHAFILSQVMKQVNRVSVYYTCNIFKKLIVQRKLRRLFSMFVVYFWHLYVFLIVVHRFSLQLRNNDTNIRFSVKRLVSSESNRSKFQSKLIKIITLLI